MKITSMCPACRRPTFVYYQNLALADRRATPGRVVASDTRGNGYENPAPASGRRPRELLAVLSAVINGSFGRIANAREQAAIEFDLPLISGAGLITVRSDDGDPIDSRYARLVTRAHPGVQAPLGWTLKVSTLFSFPLLERIVSAPSGHVHPGPLGARHDPGAGG